MNLLTTKRSSWGFLLDSLLTLMAWGTFLLLIGQGISSMIIDLGSRQGQTIDFTPLQSLSSYVLIAAFNALVIIFWGTYRTLIIRYFRKHRNLEVQYDQERAVQFNLSMPQLSNMQSSRRTIIHHSTQGQIAGLEAA